jgi:hypothetical protein
MKRHKNGTTSTTTNNTRSSDDLDWVSSTSIVGYCGLYEIHKICIDIAWEYDQQNIAGGTNTTRNNRYKNSCSNKTTGSYNHNIKLGFSLKESEWLDVTKRCAFPKQSQFTFVSNIQKNSLGYRAGIKPKDILCWPQDETNQRLIFCHDLFAEQLPSESIDKKNKLEPNKRTARYHENHHHETKCHRWKLISENDFAVRWQEFKEKNKDKNIDDNNRANGRSSSLSFNNTSSIFYFFIARKKEKRLSSFEIALVSAPVPNVTLSSSSSCTAITKTTRLAKTKSAVTSAVLTQQFIDSRITCRYSRFSAREKDSILEDAKTNAKQNFMQAYDRILASLSSSYKKRWGQIYFVKWDKIILPGLVVNPITHIGPSPTRDQWYQSYLHVCMARNLFLFQ